MLSEQSPYIDYSSKYYYYILSAVIIMIMIMVLFEPICDCLMPKKHKCAAHS